MFVVKMTCLFGGRDCGVSSLSEETVLQWMLWVRMIPWTTWTRSHSLSYRSVETAVYAACT